MLHPRLSLLSGKSSRIDDRGSVDLGSFLDPPFSILDPRFSLLIGRCNLESLAFRNHGVIALDRGPTAGHALS